MHPKPGFSTPQIQKSLPSWGGGGDTSSHAHPPPDVQYFT